MSLDLDFFWDAVDHLGESFVEQLEDTARLRDLLVAFGAGLLDRNVPLATTSERCLHALGQRIVQHIERLRADRRTKAEQRARIAEVYKKHKKLRQLQEMDPEKFEYWVAGYFMRRNFRNVVVTPFSSDYGVDIYMTCPDGRTKAVVQCKRMVEVGRPVVQQTYGVMHLVGAKRCYVVTSGRFTEAARDLASSRRDIVLIDGPQLVR